jgi:hypothetical protein
MHEMNRRVHASTTLVLGLTLLAAAAVAQGPLGHWPLDGDGVDISGNGLDGTIEGNVVAAADRNGVPNSALEFGGASGDRVNVGDPSALRLTGAMTLAGWAYLDASNTNNARVIAKMGGSGSRSWSLCVEADMGGIVNRGNFQISPDGSAVISAPTQGSVPTDGWFHIAGVYRPGQAMEIYLNGQLDDTVVAGVPASQYSDNGQPVYIGNRVACGNCGWVGSLDDVRIYDRALSAIEIHDLYGDITSPTAHVGSGAGSHRWVPRLSKPDIGQRLRGGDDNDPDRPHGHGFGQRHAVLLCRSGVQRCGRRPLFKRGIRNAPVGVEPAGQNVGNARMECEQSFLVGQCV